jgi:hypothetical protein
MMFNELSRGTTLPLPYKVLLGIIPPFSGGLQIISNPIHVMAVEWNFESWL